MKAFNEAENYNGPYPPRRRRARWGGYAGCDHHRVRAQALAVTSLSLVRSPATWSARLPSDAALRALSSAHLKQLVKKIGQDKAMEMLKGAPLSSDLLRKRASPGGYEEGFKENYALLKKLAEM